ncbi:hypothetical protein L596_025344 [Steinernema carpocapsae]|uniref:Uncharacterized protein n=1 Tax=Steinernema carpocapsae TaxID=34508 RepID=A0A4U5M7H5_STECR|nr:hypothetical protein L596_025344 [Steinernema carpocapsae]
MPYPSPTMKLEPTLIEDEPQPKRQGPTRPEDALLQECAFQCSSKSLNSDLCPRALGTATGFEPVTSRSAVECSTPELCPLDVLLQVKWRRDRTLQIGRL